LRAGRRELMAFGPLAVMLEAACDLGFETGDFIERGPLVAAALAMLGWPLLWLGAFRVDRGDGRRALREQALLFLLELFDLPLHLAHGIAGPVLCHRGQRRGGALRVEVATAV